MLIPFPALVEKYKMKPNGVIQVGTHWAQEHDAYLQCGINRFIYIEPCEKAFEVLRGKFVGNHSVKLYNLACGDVQGTQTMYTGDNTVNKGMSNSLLKPALHLQIHPNVEFDGEEEVDVEILDNIPTEDINLLVMDAQGYEGHILRGATETLKHIDYIYTEVNQLNVYEGNTLVDELDKMLLDFSRVETGVWIGQAWSDALYIRKILLQY